MEYGCIGEKLGHSFSKEIHNELADYDYSLCELAADEVEPFMRAHNFKAINVTIPYKQTVMPFLDYISNEAKQINAVNTIVNKDGKLYGYNTDFYGLKSLVERAGVEIKSKKVAVLGSGGTSCTAFAVVNSMGANSVLKVSRSQKDGYITYDELYLYHSDCDVVINTTPCGMYPKIGVCAVELDKLPKVTAVFDAVYNPLSSKLVLDAKNKGITAVGGLYMLVSQAAYAVEKFIGLPVDDSKVENIYRNLYKSKMNIVLIGMPSSGKSTVGKKLSEKLSKRFIDTDEVVVEKCKKTISEIFAEEGESGFRTAEKNAISEISKNNAQIIATGGGAVLNSQNTETLKSNGRIYFIDRPFEKLITTSDRPLSSNRNDLRKLYDERYGIYKKTADVIIDGSGTVDEVAQKIAEDFYEYSCN